MIKRLDRLDVAAADLEGAAATYQRNFGLKLHHEDDRSTILSVGDAEIRLIAPPSIEPGEGMAALWLETDDLDALKSALERCGIGPVTIAADRGRRVIAIDPAQANQVPLFIFDRKA